MTLTLILLVAVVVLVIYIFVRECRLSKEAKNKPEVKKID